MPPIQLYTLYFTVNESMHSIVKARKLMPVGCYAIILKLHASGRSRERSNIADVADTGQIHEYALKSQTKAGVLNSAILSKVKIPLIVAHIHTEIFDLLLEDIITLLALTASYYLAYAGNEKVSRRNGLAVVIKTHIEALNLCRIIGQEHRRVVDLLTDITLMLGLKVAAPIDGILEFLAGR